MVKHINIPERRKDYPAPEITILKQENECILCASIEIPGLEEDNDPFEWE